MWREYFADHPMASLGLLAMALFMVSFAGIVVFAWRKQRPELNAVASLPLQDDSFSGGTS